MRIAMTTILILVFGCGPGSRVDSHEAAQICQRIDFQAIGSPARGQRIWRLPDPRSLDYAVSVATNCPDQMDMPIAFVEAETGAFLGITQRGVRDRSGRSTRERRDFDDFTWRRTRKSRPSKSCRPGDMRDLREANRIERIEARRIHADASEQSAQEFEFASEWLIRCLPEKAPLAWLTPDGQLIGVYHSKRFDRFD